MKYDDASWHYGGDFPKDLPREAGATHIGMYVAWCLLNDLGSIVDFEPYVKKFVELKVRKITPGRFLIDACDEKFVEQMISAEGNGFTRVYFEPGTGKYLLDYERIFVSDGSSLYHVPDTWESFDKIAPIIEKRFKCWTKHGSVEEPVRKWWRFWA